MKTNQRSPGLSIGLVFDDSLDSSDGVAQYVKTLGAWLSAQGHDVTYLVGQTKLQQWHGGSVISLSRNLRVVFNGNRLSVPLPSKRRHLKVAIESGDFDVLHVMMPHSPLMAQRLVNQAAAKTAVIGTFHIYPAGWLAEFGGRVLKLWYGRKLRRFDQIVSVSPAAQTYAAEVFKINSEVVPNVVELSRFKAVREDRDTQADIVYLGRLVPRKGCLYLLRAFANIKDKSIRLIIAGDGPQRNKLEAEAARLGVADRVEFRGYIEESEKPSLLAAAKLACFPALFGESFGIVLIEAMAAGSGVVIGGDNPGYRTVLGEQPDLLVDPKNTPEFSDRLTQMLSDEKLAAQRHTWQLENVKPYDIETVGPKLLDIYQKQIAKRLKKGNN